MKRFVLVVLAVMSLWNVDLMAQSACLGLKNPLNFMLYPAYSGQIGSKPSRASNCNAGTVGITFTGGVIANNQLAAQTSTQGNSYCGQTLQDNTRFRIMSNNEGPGTGANLGKDPCTSYGIPYCPQGYVKSIRVGQCRTGAEAEGLYYTMNVTPDNALVFINYAIVIQAPGHGVSSDPEFIIRVTRQSGATYTPISDTLCYVVSSTPSSNGGSVTIGQDGWHSTNGSGSTVYYRDWNLVAINLYDYLYQNVRIEIMIGDCSAHGHYGYCYITGDCQPMRLEANGCAAGESDNVGRISAPQGLAQYQWYKSRTGFLQGTAANDPNNYVPINNANDTVLDVTEAHFITSNGDTVPQQSFMCEMTSYMDPTKPIKSQLFTDVMNKKPKLALDTILECNSTVTLIDRSQAPIVERPEDNVDTQYTYWTIYGDRDTFGTPVYTGSGGKATYTFPQAGFYAVTVRTSARDTSCWNKKTVLVRAIAPINPGFEFERNDLCFRDIIAIGDTTTGSEWRRWVLHNRDGSTDTLADTSRVIHISFDDTTLVELVASARPADVSDENGNRIQKLCPNNVSKTIRVGRYPELIVDGDTIVCIGSSGDIDVSTDVEGCTFEWYDAMGANAPFSSSTHITVSPRRSTWYYVKVTTHPNECFTWDSIFVRVVDPTLAASTHQICVGDTVWLTATNAYSYSWSANPRDNDLEHWNNDSVTHPVIFVTPEVTTTYTMVGHGSNGCNSNPLTETITVYPYPIPKVDYTPTFVDSEDPSVTFHDLSQYGVRTLWNFGDGSTSTMKDATYSFTDISRDSVCVSLFSFNTLGCVSDTTFCLPVVLFSAWLPNTFTPALGGENAFFRIYSGNTLEHFSMFIYDRAGRMVYRSHDQYEGWDGTNLNGDDCLEGIYVYVCSYRRPNTTDITTRKGSILLIR